MPVALPAKGTAKAGLVVNRAPTTERVLIELRNPVTHKLQDYAVHNLAIRNQYDIGMVQPNQFLNQKLALCGAGPSLDPRTIRGVDQVWACNSAVPYLASQGAKLDVAIGIDQTPGLFREWADPPDVQYYIASTCDPALVSHLIARKLRIQFFHNAVGFEDEREHYNEDWPPGFMLGHGATVLCRSIGLAEWQGFERVDIHGGDCAFSASGAVHANGDSPAEAYGRPLLMRGEIDGREWTTRPDMLMEAVNLARRSRHSMGRIRLMGDTLPVALLGKTEEVLDQVASYLQPGQAPTEN